MDQQTLKKELIESHQSFVAYVNSLSIDEYLLSKNEKWTPGQQLEHIYLSVRPLRQVLSLPKFLLKLIWGQANRSSKNYENLVKKYLQKLENGGRATGRFIPKPVTMEKGHKLSIQLENEIAALASKLDNFTEEEVDNYILPHPLLGKLTLREMIYFTIYHVGHHQKLTKRNLS